MRLHRRSGAHLVMIFVVLSSCLPIIVAIWFLCRRTRLPLPPGPRKLPLIGNLLDIPKKNAWEQYARWGKEFGKPMILLSRGTFLDRSSDSDIIHLDVAGTSIVVLNSVEAASELLDGRSALYSDR